MKIKAESIIWFLIVFLISMFVGYLGYLIYLTLFYRKKTLEGYDNQRFKRLQGITKICNPGDDDSAECVSVKFYDYDDNIRSVKAILQPGYNVDPNTGFAQKIDNKTKFDTDYRSFTNPVSNKEKDKEPKFDKDNLDIKYHEDPAKLPNAKDDLIGYTVQLDDNGNVDTVPYSEIKGKTLYNQPGNSRFGPSSYVPNYEETVFLSKLTNETYFQNVELEDSGSLGFCKNKSLDDVEKKCNSLDNQTCASTDCCVLFGGAKCVAGNSRGPSKQSNYNDFLVKNRDYYYYKGKCYGSCSQSNPIRNIIGQQIYHYDFSAVNNESDDNNESIDKKHSDDNMQLDNWKKNNNWWKEHNDMTKPPSTDNIAVGLTKDIIYQ